MKKGKGFFIGMVALLVATVGLIIALAAYFKNRSSYLYDDEDFLFDNPDDFAYYNTGEHHGHDDFSEDFDENGVGSIDIEVDEEA